MDFRFMDLFMDQRICFISGYADWIRSREIEGNVAECRVFRGDSAKYINYYFPDRKLYLCDTFEREREIRITKTPIGDGCSMALLKD